MVQVIRFAARLLPVLGLLLVAAAPVAQAASDSPFPSLVIASPGASGAAAVSALGSALPAVAAYYGKTPERLRAELLRDGGLRVGRTGRLYHVSPPAAPGGGSEAAAAAFGMPWAPAHPAPLAETFQLHSSPGAAKTIYLNFRGRTLTAASHGILGELDQLQIVVPPFGSDGNAAFSDAELIIIQEVWQRVAEDYAPFDVDVTTESPAQDRITRADAADPHFGIEVLFAAEAEEWKCMGCAGLSYAQAFFDVADDTRKPAVVFHAPATVDPKTLGDAASRELGIGLGLSTDGVSTGDGYYDGQGSSPVNGWAPIMSGLSSRPLRQFDKGEYANALSYTGYGEAFAPEDDFAVITGNGLPLRADEAGNSVAAATWLPVESSGGRSAAAFDGVITSSADADVFWLRAGVGLLEVRADPAAVGANADLTLTLRDSAGNVVETSSPVQNLSASISRSIATPGRYYVEVRGAGEGDPRVTGYSSYGSVGAYALSGSFVTPPNGVPNASFSATPPSGRAPLPVTLNPSASGDADGQIMRYVWDFGDGTSRTESAPTPRLKTFNAARDYTVTLRVIDDTGLSSFASRQVNVASATNAAPVAAFTASAVSGVAPLAVTFNAGGSTDDGRIVSYSWDFGDGSPPTVLSAAVASRTFTRAGSYTVRLTVTDDGGLVSDAVTRVITVTAAPPPAPPPPQSPVAAFTASAAGGVAPLQVIFDSSASSDDGLITSVRWDFGDGTTQDGTAPGVVAKTFAKAGTYTVRLTVTDDGGLTGEAVRDVTVRDAPVARVPRVTDVSVIFARAGRNRVKGRAAVSVVDANGKPASGATVIARWSGLVEATSSARTSRNGRVNLTAPSTTAAGCVRLTVVSVQLGSATYPADPPVVGEACR